MTSRPAVAVAPGTTSAARGWTLDVDQGDLALSAPAVVSDDAVTVFLTGELYNPDALADVADTDPRHPPEALLLKAVRRRGVAAILPLLRGQFVVAVADRRASRVHVARDPLGAHPLFYAVTPKTCSFAADIRTLLARPGVSRSLNRLAVADHLCKRWPNRDETFFEHVHRIPPGWQAVITRDGCRTERYWHPVGEEIDWLPDEDVERFDDLLEQAVTRGLGGGRAGIFLSGGFDSVSVAAVAADRCRQDVRPAPLALSLAFPDPTCDERLVQTSVAHTLGLPLHIRAFADAAGPNGLLAEGLALNATLDAPLFNSWMPAYLSLIRHARLEGVTTILTGEGGDEWLGATPFLAADLMRRGDVPGLVNMARTWKRSYHQSWPAVVRGTLWRYGLRPLVGMACSVVAGEAWDDRRAKRVVASHPAWIGADPAIRLAQYDRARAALAPARPSGGFYQRESRLFLDHALNSWLFEEQHQLGQRLGVRYVHPYWDADLVAHVYRVRPERLNENHRTKALVRRTVARRFPALGFERQRKVAALDFFASILRSEGPGLGESVADFSGLASLGVVRPEGARAFMRSAWGSSPMDAGRAWNLVNMEAWVRQQLD